MELDIQILKDKISQVQEVPVNPNLMLTGYEDKVRNYYTKVCNQAFPELIEQISADPRIIALEGKLVGWQESKSQPNINSIAYWLLWRMRAVGIEKALEDYENFFNNETLDIDLVVWVYGPNPDRIYKFSNGVWLVPIKDMPDSSLKEKFMGPNLDALNGYRPLPQAALVNRVKVQKVISSPETINIEPEYSDFWQNRSKIKDIVMLLNCLKGVHCASAIEVDVYPAHIPPGFFQGGSQSQTLRDILPFRTCRFAIENEKIVDDLLISFKKLKHKEQESIAAVIRRFSQVKWRSNIDDKFLDLGICLEMLLLNNLNKQERPDQLSLTFRLRGSWFLATNYQERLEFYDILKRVYNLRSEIAHNGYSRSLAKTKPTEVNDLLNKGMALAENLIQSIISKGYPKNWDDLILGKITNDKG